MLTDFLYFIISALGLVISATFLVKSLYRASKFLRISEFAAAFIIMAIATAIPEFFIGIYSAILKIPVLSLGNVIGASIIDLTLITGIFVLISRKIKTQIGEEKDIYYVIFSIILVTILFFLGKSLSRFDGFLLIALFIFNSYRMLRKRKRFPKKLKKDTVRRIEIICLVFLFALIILVISSNYIVKYASSLAIDLKIPQIIVGLFLLSITTTLPELIFGIEACLLKHKGMAMGDISGGVFTYMTLILGTVSIISPIKVDFLPFIVSALFLLLSAFIFLRFLKTGRELKIIEGISLILIYVVFIVIEFLIIA